jgi:hypothetical protein
MAAQMFPPIRDPTTMETDPAICKIAIGNAIPVANITLPTNPETFLTTNVLELYGPLSDP